MQELKQLGLDKNTIVMFSSDNGPTFNGGVRADVFESTAGYRGLKMDVFEGGIRVPFIARWPQHIPAGQITELPSVQYDLMATLAELTGGKINQTDGTSFLPTLLGKPAEQQARSLCILNTRKKEGKLLSACKIGKA